MEIEDRIRKGRTVYYIYYEHLGWWKRRRFVDMYTERVRNGVPFMQVINTWNDHATRPEDTVYVVTKFVTEPLPTSPDFEDNQGRYSVLGRDNRRATE